MPTTLPPKGSYRLGVISDTHGYLPLAALELFRNVDLILHAGDIGSRDVLATLEQAAPVLAVRGNMDGGAWADALSETETLRLGPSRIHLIHDLARLRPPAPDGGCLAVVAGHTHRPRIEKRDGVLYVNPGSAGAPRRGEPAGVALIRVDGACASAELIPLAE